jgi:hypothetical protein
LVDVCSALTSRTVPWTTRQWAFGQWQEPISSRLWSACMVCILSCRASMVSSWSATFLHRAVFSLSNFLTLLLPKREPTLSAMLAAAVVAAPFSFSVCISFFARLSSSRAVSFCYCKFTTSALRLSASFCISRSYCCDPWERKVCTLYSTESVIRFTYSKP